MRIKVMSARVAFPQQEQDEQKCFWQSYPCHQVGGEDGHDKIDEETENGRWPHHHHALNLRQCSIETAPLRWPD